MTRSHKLLLSKLSLCRLLLSKLLLCKLPLCCLLLSLAAPHLAAQQIAAQQPPQRDPQALALLNSSVSAMGAGAIPTARSGQNGLVVSGTYKPLVGTPASYPFRVKVLGFDRFRWETDRPEGMIVTTVSRFDAWLETPEGVSPLSVGATIGRQLEIFPTLMLAEWQASSNVNLQAPVQEGDAGRMLHRLAGSRIFAGKVSAQFQAAFGQMTRAELLIDAQTNLPTRLKYSEHPADWRSGIPIELTYSDFRNVGGVLVPFVITRHLRGQPLDEFRFESFNLGVVVKDSEFERRRP